MKINRICLTCKNWETEKCGTCLFINSTGKTVKPQDILFTNYIEIPITCKMYKERTNRNWSTNGNVYTKVVSPSMDKEEINQSKWYIRPYYEAEVEGYPIVCVLSEKSPPKKWLPNGYKLGSSEPH